MALGWSSWLVYVEAPFVEDTSAFAVANVFFNSLIFLRLQLLDLGSVDPARPSCDQNLQAMIRSDSVSKGDIYVEPVSGSKVEVLDIRG